MLFAVTVDCAVRPDFSVDGLEAAEECILRAEPISRSTSPTATEPKEASMNTLHGDPVQKALALAEETSRDGRQRALDYVAGDLDELLQLRLEVKEAIGTAPAGAAIRFVRPWLWRTASSGHALTDAGRETGYEIRLSRYQADHY
jgi:hypothetical protein